MTRTVWPPRSPCARISGRVGNTVRFVVGAGVNVRRKLAYTLHFENPGTRAVVGAVRQTLPTGVVWGATWTPVSSGSLSFPSAPVFSDAARTITISDVTIGSGASTLLLRTLDLNGLAGPVESESLLVIQGRSSVSGGQSTPANSSVTVPSSTADRVEPTASLVIGKGFDEANVIVRLIFSETVAPLDSNVINVYKGTLSHWKGSGNHYSFLATKDGNKEMDFKIKSEKIRDLAGNKLSDTPPIDFINVNANSAPANPGGGLTALLAWIMSQFP